jgi:uncharacterized membrane protein YfbV (UPF0208 family)
MVAEVEMPVITTTFPEAAMLLLIVDQFIQAEAETLLVLTLIAAGAAMLVTATLTADHLTVALIIQAAMAEYLLPLVAVAVLLLEVQILAVLAEPIMVTPATPLLLVAEAEISVTLAVLAVRVAVLPSTSDHQPIAQVLKSYNSSIKNKQRKNSLHIFFFSFFDYAFLCSLSGHNLPF